MTYTRSFRPRLISNGMKFSCLKEKLEKALAAAERFTGKNTNLPILGNVLLEVNNNALQITATNLEYAVQISLPGKMTEQGKISVPAKIISSLVQSIKEEKVDLEEKGGNLLIKTETRDTRINGIPAGDFPITPKIKKSHTFLIDAAALQSGLEKILPSVSLSEFKPELTGVFFNIQTGTLKLAATDTFRLAEKSMELLKKSEGANFSFILPHRVSQEISRTLGIGGDEASVSFGDNQMLFESGNIKIISRVIEGNFPDYSGIIPKKFDVSGFLDRDDLLNSVKSASIFSSKIQDVTLNFHPKNLEVLSNNPEIGENKISIPVSSTGKDVKISFNYRYLLDGLNVLDNDEIFIGCNSEANPSLIRNKTDDSFLYVLMPIRSV